MRKLISTATVKQLDFVMFDEGRTSSDRLTGKYSVYLEIFLYKCANFFSFYRAMNSLNTLLFAVQKVQYCDHFVSDCCGEIHLLVSVCK